MHGHVLERFPHDVNQWKALYSFVCRIFLCSSVSNELENALAMTFRATIAQ